MPDKHMNRQTYTLTDTYTNKHMDRQTQTDTHPYAHTAMHTYSADCIQFKTHKQTNRVVSTDRHTKRHTKRQTLGTTLGYKFLPGTNTIDY